MVKRIRGSIVCVHNGSLLVFKGVDPDSGKVYWLLPGGAIEPGEKAWECAERETMEETGYRVHVLRDTELKKEYPFTWDKIPYDCTTYFYKGVLKDKFVPPSPVQDVSYNKGAYWLPLTEAEKAFSYNTEIQEAVLRLIDSGND